MTKAQAADVLRHITTKYEGHQQALDKAIEVLSDKTEYVKRSTYRKLKETYEHQENCYVQLMADASEYRMNINKLKGRNLLERILNKDLR